jgi:hypothetical protein
LRFFDRVEFLVIELGNFFGLCCSVKGLADDFS